MTQRNASLPCPPRLTRDEAHARTLLARRVQACDVILGGEAWRLSLQPLARDACTAFGESDWRVRADWAGAAFLLRLPAAAADQWLRARFATLDLPALPIPVRDAAFETALHDVVEALTASGQGVLRIDSIDSEPSAIETGAAPAHQFALALSRSDHTVHATLSTDTSGLLMMAGRVAALPSVGGPLDDCGVPIRLTGEIGECTLAQAELMRLRPGDALLMHRSYLDQGGQFWLRYRGWGLRVRIDDCLLTVTEAFKTMESMMKYSDDRSTNAPGDDLVALDALPVHLRFDLGDCEMPLSELRGLQVGQVIELERPLSQAVGIRANGALIGTGELMEIGGRIAVSITTLGSREEMAE